MSDPRIFVNPRKPSILWRSVKPTPANLKSFRAKPCQAKRAK